jgi:probable HAF family extracellular repeat protein
LAVEILEDRYLLSYTVTDLGLLGRMDSTARGINAAGEVVGWGGPPRTGPVHAYLYDGSAFTDLGTLGGHTSGATAINDAGQVVGLAGVPGGHDHAFLYSDGVMTDLGTLGAGDSAATGINNAGEVVGGSEFPGGHLGQPHAFLYRDGVMTDLGTLGGGQSYAYGINNAGAVVGVAFNPDNLARPFLYQDGQLMDLGSLGGGGYALGLNDVGQVVGFSATTTGNHVFLWDNTNGMQDLGTLGSGDSETTAYAVNNFGQVVGTSDYRAFLYSDGVMTDLNTLIPPDSDFYLSTAYGINDAGQIVGLGAGPNLHAHAFLLTPDGNSAPHGHSPTALRVSDSLPATQLLAPALTTGFTPVSTRGTDDTAAFVGPDRPVTESGARPATASERAGHLFPAGGRALDDLVAVAVSDRLNAPVLEAFATNLMSVNEPLR